MNPFFYFVKELYAINISQLMFQIYYTTLDNQQFRIANTITYEQQKNKQTLPYNCAL